MVDENGKKIEANIEKINEAKIEIDETKNEVHDTADRLEILVQEKIYELQQETERQIAETQDFVVSET
jgi:hypothetical protein